MSPTIAAVAVVITSACAAAVGYVLGKGRGRIEMAHDLADAVARSSASARALAATASAIIAAQAEESGRYVIDENGLHRVQ